MPCQLLLCILLAGQNSEITPAEAVSEASHSALDAESPKPELVDYLTILIRDKYNKVSSLLSVS
jgi:hypothetical protein